MKKYLILLFVVFISMSYKCKRDKDNCHDCIKIVNKTNSSLCFSTSFGIRDSLWVPDYNPLNVWGKYEISPNADKKDCNRYGDCFEADFLNDVEYIYIYIYDKNLVEKNWDSVRANYLVLHRYQLALEDLEKMNWTVVYPPE